MLGIKPMVLHMLGYYYLLIIDGMFFASLQGISGYS